MMQILRGPRHKASKRILFRVSRLYVLQEASLPGNADGRSLSKLALQAQVRKLHKSAWSIKAAKASRSASGIGLSEGSIFSACSIYPTYPGAEEDWKTSEEVAGTRTRIHLSCSNDGQPYNRGIGHIRPSFYGPQILITPRHNIVVSRL